MSKITYIILPINIIDRIKIQYFSDFFAKK